MFNLFKKKESPKIEIKSVVHKEDFEKFLYEWNVNNPIDRWWRKKYNIGFNTPSHRVCSFIDMFFEFKEDNLFKELVQDSVNESEYKPGDYLKEQEGVDLSDDDMKNFFKNYQDKE